MLPMQIPVHRVCGTMIRRIETPKEATAASPYLTARLLSTRAETTRKRLDTICEEPTESTGLSTSAESVKSLSDHEKFLLFAVKNSM